MICPKCSKELREGAKFCKQCGFKIVYSQKKICKACNLEFDMDDIFCDECGEELTLISEIETNTASDDKVDIDIIKNSQTESNSEINDKLENKEIHEDIESLDTEDAYVEIMKTYLKVAISKTIIEMKHYRIDDHFKSINIKECNKIIEKTWGDFDTFFETFLLQRIKNQSFDDMDQIRLRVVFREFVFLDMNISEYWDPNDTAILFLKNDGFGDAILLDVIKYSTLHIEGEESKKLVQGKAVSKEVLELLQKAINSKYMSNLAVLLAGNIIDCFDESDANIVKELFGIAANRGIEEAKVYYTNYERRKNLKPSNSYVFIQDKNTITKQLKKACYVLDGFLYFTSDSGQYEQIEICRMEIATGKVQILYKTKSNQSYGHCLDYKNVFPLFSISNGKIYFPSNFTLYSMNLDGSDAHILNGFEKGFNDQLIGVIANSKGLVFARINGVYRYYFGIDNKPEKILPSVADIIDFSDDKIVTSSGNIIDIESKTKTKVSKEYPAIKGKDLLMVDGVNSIAYYLEKDDDLDIYSRIIGTDKNGDVVDIWKLPLLSSKQYSALGQDYSSIVFNGSRMTYKTNALTIDVNYYSDDKEPGCGMYIADYTRDGLENVIFSTEEYNHLDVNRFGMFHYTTLGANFVLKGVDPEKKIGTYWSVMISDDGKVIPFAKYY